MIPRAPTSPEGRKENFFSDAVMRLAKAEADEERLGELLADAFRARASSTSNLRGEKPERKGRRPNAVSDSKILADIRAKNPKSDGRKHFMDRLTALADKGKQLGMTTARRRYNKAAALLAEQK